MIYLVADRLTYGLADSFTCFLTRLSTHSLAYDVTFQSASHLDRKHTLPLPLPLPNQSASHLDGKHTVFGRVVGGLDTLTKIEKVKTDKDDKPTTEQVSRE